jgi:hypothetical protein
MTPLQYFYRHRCTVRTSYFDTARVQKVIYKTGTMVTAAPSYCRSEAWNQSASIQKSNEIVRLLYDIDTIYLEHPGTGWNRPTWYSSTGMVLVLLLHTGRQHDACSIAPYPYRWQLMLVLLLQQASLARQQRIHGSGTANDYWLILLGHFWLHWLFESICYRYKNII